MFHAGHDHAHHLLRRAGFGINATVLILLLLTASFALVGVNGVLNQRLPEPVYSYLFVAVVVVYALLLNRILPLTRPIRQYLSGQMVVVSTDATDAAEGRRP